MKRECPIGVRLRAFLCIVVFGFVALTVPAKAAAPLPITVYCASDAFADVLRERIPRGTPRSEVEKFLVDENGASIQADQAPRNKPNVFHYWKPVHCPLIGDRDQWTVNVTYDRNNRVWRLSATGASNLLSRVIPTNLGDAGIFDFDDYDTPEELTKTLRVLFPLGTSRGEVEKVLIKWNQARAWTNSNEPQAVVYTCDTRFLVPNGNAFAFAYRSWAVKISYLTKFDELSQITVSGSEPVRAFKHDRDYYLKLNKKNKEHQ